VLCTGLTGVTGLTGAGHRSDRRSTGSKPCKFPLYVLVCFGSEGCLLVPRFSSTLVAAWAWPTWVVSQRSVLEAMFVLYESPSPSRRIFIGSHSLPPLWFAVSVLQDFVEVPNKEEIAKLNLMKSIFKSRFPVQLRRRPCFEATVLSQRTHIHAG
jgi:hypothetical protein